MHAIIRILAVIIFLSRTAALSPDTRCSITIENAHKKKIALAVEIADNESERRAGLMHRRSLADNSGMLFVFPDSDFRNFWMKNTLIPLSIAYIGPSGVIDEILDMKPMDISVTYPSKTPARYALEVPLGWFSNNGIGPGCRVFFHGCLGK